MYSVNFTVTCSSSLPFPVYKCTVNFALVVAVDKRSCNLQRFTFCRLLVESFSCHIIKR